MGVSLRTKNLAGGGSSYYLDIYHNGKRSYETLDIHLKKGEKDYKEKKELAESIRDKRSLELMSQEHDYVPKFKKNTDFIKYYDNYIEEYSKTDVRMHKFCLVKFKDFTKGKTITFKDLTTHLIEGFKDYLVHKAGLSGETPHDYFARFKRAVKYAQLSGIINTNPCDGVTIKNKGKNSLKKNILTKEELQLLAVTSCANSETKRAFLFACFTGFGYAEVIMLKWKDIQNGKVNTNRAKTSNQVWNDLSSTALGLLGERGKSDEYIFILPSDTAVNKAIKKWVCKAGIDKHITFYCGRHAFAVLLLENGANLKTVADLMGHSNTQHTVKYLNYIDKLKTDAINNLPNIDL